jgi:exonuclease VII small subunit
MPSDSSARTTERELSEVSNEMLKLLTPLEEIGNDFEADRTIYEYQLAQLSEHVTELQKIALELEERGHE